MEISEATRIVLELAKQNALDPNLCWSDGLLEQARSQQQAIALLESTETWVVYERSPNGGVKVEQPIVGVFKLFEAATDAAISHIGGVDNEKIVVAATPDYVVYRAQPDLEVIVENHTK